MIPDDQAAKGMENICQVISQGRFQLIIPLSLQDSYHLGRLGFFDEADERVRNFVHQARPAPGKVNQGIYVSVGIAPFLDMCGQRLHHHGIPVVPVLHVKQWPLRPQMTRYKEPMLQAAEEIRHVLGASSNIQGQ